ncbi:YcaO-like family protein [Brachybacterium tyrofermentans]|uniref:YcaO-like family protein n=1 Tax=Brachybacterium tyrofermentans TaxID=47848 RepID=UPI001866DE87|nr:YcaO-like family protein [Brachybacterium tyrofermentans]
MTRLSVHTLGDDRLLVCTDAGRRFEVAAPPSNIGNPVVQDLLRRLRQEHPDDDLMIAPAGNGALKLECLAALPQAAHMIGEPALAQWTFAGQAHRVRLEPETAEHTAREVVGCLLATIADPEHAAALVRPALIDDLSAGLIDEPVHVEGTAWPDADVLERWEHGAWHEHRLDPPALLDPVTGILRRVVERPSEPRAPEGFVHLHAELPHLTSVDPTYQPDPLAPAGALQGAPLSAHDEGVLSGIAHLCGAYLGQGTRRSASADELRREGHRVLTVSQWRPHDPRLHDIPGFPFVRDDPAQRMWWLEGKDERGSCWVPLSLVHAGYLASGLEGLPATNGHNLVGLQAGFSAAQARDRAAAHLIAQDAVAHWWRDGSTHLAEAPPPQAVTDGWGESPWRVTVLEVPTPYGAPVRLAVIDDTDEDIVALGYGCASTADEAATRAVSEALVQHASARDLDRPDGLIRRAERLGNGGVAGLAPHDPARGYSAAFAGRRLLIDPMCHLQHGLDPVVAEETRQRTRPEGHADHTGSAPVSPFETLRRSTQVVQVDVTTDRVRRAGAHAVRLLAPALARLGAAAFDYDTNTVPYPGW